MESRQKIEGTVDSKTGLEGNRKKQTPGRDNSTSGRRRGSRANDRTKPRISPPTVLQSNGQLENSCQKVCLFGRVPFTYDSFELLNIKRALFRNLDI